MIFTQDGEVYMKLETRYATDEGEIWDDGYNGIIKEVCIGHGKIIFSIQTAYEREGLTVLSRIHGGTSGSFDLVSLSEPLKWVTGHYCSYNNNRRHRIFYDYDDSYCTPCTVVGSLKFATDRASYGPFGYEDPEGEPFSFKSSSGIKGFHGRSTNSRDGYLNDIGVYLKSSATRLMDEAS